MADEFEPRVQDANLRKVSQPDGCRARKMLAKRDCAQAFSAEKAQAQRWKLKIHGAVSPVEGMCNPEILSSTQDP